MHATRTLVLAFVVLLWSAMLAPAAAPPSSADPPAVQPEMTRLLDAPLLFVKRHSYTGIHIYDTYYKWPPGGGGIYVLENPAAPRDQWKIRPVIDPTTPGTLGFGVYTHPELSWDAKKLLFCFKGEPNGNTRIYEIGIDGTGLRPVTDPSATCELYKGGHSGQHDIAPAYLPDGRIVFLTTRPSGLVPCANSGVSILHVMNADGTDIHPISVNNVNEFDPSVLPDGRILFGRWEYVDKNALTIQSLWSVNPDGTQETAVFANNAVFPESVLDARIVPGTDLIVGTFAKHNSTPRGSIAIIDPRVSKNEPQAIYNLEHPEDPTFDRGDSCEPWPVTAEVFVFSGRPRGQTRNVLEMIDRAGHRFVLMADPDICLHAPMLIKPRPVPAVIPDTIDRNATTGRFFVQDIYRGLTNVRRGEIKFLRVIEETSRVSPTTMGGSPYNQVFLLSCALAFSVKNYLGVVPVDENGSAYFEVPSGRAVYLQAIDGDGRLVQSMRTFVQAAPGTTRACIGCHEHKYTAAGNRGLRDILGQTPRKLQPESWGSGFVDYPGMVQPILDRHCVSCHGGEKGIGGGMDLSGGWTEHFNISYENLTNRCESQLTAYWISGIDCMNGTALWSSQLFPPRSHGSGAAPLAKILVEGHKGYIPNLSRTERDVLMAWMDSNGLFRGTWDYNANGCAVKSWNNVKSALMAQMQIAGCVRCHGDGTNVNFFENDWINLKDPQFSRILRAALPEGADGFGLGLCRDRKADPQRQRLRLLVNGYAHAVQPPEAFPRRQLITQDLSGPAVASFASKNDPHYQAMLGLIRPARQQALAAPRVDMPGAEVLPGECRTFLPPPVPAEASPPHATIDREGVVQIACERSARTIGLEVEIHRAAQANFAPTADTLLSRTALFRHTDRLAPAGTQHYAAVFVSGNARSQPAYISLTVPQPAPPPAPSELRVVPSSCSVRLQWLPPDATVIGYNVYRSPADGNDLTKLTAEPVRLAEYSDMTAELQKPYRYIVRAVSPRGIESEPTPPLEASATEIKEPMFAAPLTADASGKVYGGATLAGKLHGKARFVDGVLNLSQGGHVTFPHHGFFDLAQPFSVECSVWFDEPGQMPVFVSCGSWNQAGWFIQRIGGGWRWHVGGFDCDGGKPEMGRWIHLVATYDGRTARLFQDGALVAEKAGAAVTAPWPGELHVGQYSASPGPPYQTAGRITGVKLYHRPLTATEAAEAAKAKPH